MVYNRFSIFLLLRIGLILTNLIAISVLYSRQDLFYTSIFLGFLLIVQVFLLISFVNTTNRELTKFVLAVQDSDNTAKFPDHSGSFNELFRSFELILGLLKNQETEKEAQFQYLQHIINTIDIAIVSVDDQGKTALSNRSANHLRERYSFPQNRSLIETLLSSPNTFILKASNESFGHKELMVSRSQLKLMGVSYTIFTLKDIKTQLETREIESWQKLIRILAHEIMNSVTPISSLSETTLSIVNKEINANSIEGKDLSNIKASVGTIKTRSESLLAFLEDYRKLIKVPSPKKDTINLDQFCRDILTLFESQLNREKIEVSTDLRCTTIFADRIQLEQVFINLITNACQSMQESRVKKLDIRTSEEEDTYTIEVVDSGPGIEVSKMEKIFVPFYTTKPDGSGIGLSLSRQIINQHEGQLIVESKPGTTNFIIKLPVEQA